MYSVSQRYLTAMKKPVQRFRMVGTVAGVPFADDQILKGSFSISNKCSDENEIRIGQVYTAELNVTFMRNLNLQRYSLKDGVIEPYFGLHLSGGTYENVPLGIFNIHEAEWTASGVVIHAYDNILKLAKSFKSKNLSGTPYNILKLACESCGLTLNMRAADFKNFANGTRTLKLYGENNIETWRDCVQWVAQTLAANVFADRIGRIYLKSYNQDPVDTIGAEHRFTGASFGDYETRYTGISVVNMETQMTNYYGLEVDDALTYNLGSNPFMQGEESEAMCREVLSAMEQICYVPFSVTMIGNPAYDLMDVLSFEGGHADADKLSCITKYTFNYNGEYSCSGVGTDPAMASASSKSDKNISGLMNQINSITNAINRLIYDFNTDPLTIGTDEQTIAMVTYYISENADVEGHFLMNYKATESTHLVLRFYDQVTEELFSPVEYDILAGEGTISVPHAYLQRQSGVHAVYATAQVYSGQIDVETRGALFSLDAGNFAEAVDDVTMDVRDITLRQLMESNGPDQVWIIGIEDGKMLVSRREYRDSYTSNPVWEGVYTAGDAIDAAIEFDGSWVLRAGSYQYTIETEDQPWYFWIDPEYNLYAQKGELEDTRLLLDTSVTSISACRGYSSEMYVEQDQGLVIAYIKEGKAYYAQYIYDVGLEGKRWLPAELLTDEDVEEVRVHRLNDYRLGFEITTADRNLWKYTARTYVAQAVPKEDGNIVLSDKTMFLYIHEDADLSFTLSNWISDDGLKMRIYVSKEIRWFDDWKTLLQFDATSVTEAMVEKVTVNNDGASAVIEIKLNEKAKKLITNVTINPNGNNDVQLCIPDWGYVQLPKTTIIFDTTIYRHAAMPEEQGSVQNTDFGMQYAEIINLRTTTNEEASVQNTGYDMQYALIGTITYNRHEESATVQLAGVSMAYEQVAPTPI